MFSKSSQKGRCLEGSGRDFFSWEGYMQISLGFFGGLVSVEEMRISMNFFRSYE